MSRFVYLDHSATTPVDQRVIDAMMPFFAPDFGNPTACMPGAERQDRQWIKPEIR